MLDTDINSLEKQKISLEIELNNLLKDSNKDNDKINELRSEILHIQKQIRRILGTKEVENQREIKRKKLRTDEKNIDNYNSFKLKYQKISKMEIATKRIISLIDAYAKSKDYQDGMVKVMSR